MKRAAAAAADKGKDEEGDEEEEEEEEEEEDVPLEPKTFGRRNRGLLVVSFLAPRLTQTAGRMIQKMIATQPAGDEFWDERAQAFFAEEEGDKGFDVALDPDAHYVDKVDSDFDEDESSAASESEAEEEKGPKAKSTYVDPRNRGAKKKQKTEPAATAAATAAEPVAPSVAGATPAPEKREKRVYKKKQVA